jgi:hypothetical protein
MTAQRVSRRRLLPAAALVLASMLEICGCNPVPDCALVGNLQLASLDWPAILEHCAKCLSAREIVDLRQTANDLAVNGTSLGFRSDLTVRQALAQKEEGAIYDPVSAHLKDANIVGDFGSLHQVPSPEAMANSDIKFTPWPIPESVYFLYKKIEDASGSPHRVASATAFILSVPDRDHHTLARFIVTARHVVDPQWAHCSDQNPASIEVRLNRRDGGVGYETVPLESGRRRRYDTPLDGTSDLAIIRIDDRLIPDLDTYKSFDTPFSLLPTQSDIFKIAQAQNGPSRDRPGHLIVTASLRTQVPTDLSAFPLSDFGIIASTTTEPVSVQCGSGSPPTPLKVWFINASIEQGDSGAPVYTSVVRSGQTARTPILIGVQAIAWPDRGVAGITPSSVLADLVQRVLNATAHKADFYRGATPWAHSDN